MKKTEQSAQIQIIFHKTKKDVDKVRMMWYSTKAVRETASTTEKLRMRERKSLKNLKKVLDKASKKC